MPDVPKTTKDIHPDHLRHCCLRCSIYIHTLTPYNLSPELTPAQKYARLKRSRHAHLFRCSPTGRVHDLHFRWSSQLGFLSRLVLLEQPIGRYLQKNPQSAQRGLSPSEWLTIKEVCSVLEPLREVNTRIQGGQDGLLSRTIFLCNELQDVLCDDIVEIIDWSSRRDNTASTAE